MWSIILGLSSTAQKVVKEQQREVKDLENQEVVTRSSHDLCFRSVEPDLDLHDLWFMNYGVLRSVREMENWSGILDLSKWTPTLCIQVVKWQEVFTKDRTIDSCHLYTSSNGLVSTKQLSHTSLTNFAACTSSLTPGLFIMLKAALLFTQSCMPWLNLYWPLLQNSLVNLHSPLNVLALISVQAWWRKFCGSTLNRTWSYAWIISCASESSTFDRVRRLLAQRRMP